MNQDHPKKPNIVATVHQTLTKQCGTLGNGSEEGKGEGTGEEEGIKRKRKRMEKGESGEEYDGGDDERGKLSVWAITVK